MAIVNKDFNALHKRVHFGEGAYSDRVVLPGLDGVRQKVTRFFAPRGWRNSKPISYQVDEIVYVEKGHFRLKMEGREVVHRSGDIYIVPAGEAYDMEMVNETTLVCVFTPGPNGTIPDDE